MAKVFISYSLEDKVYLDELEKHLSVLRKEGYITNWSNKQITAGTEWSDKITEELEAADIILLLVSAGFLASDRCYDVEMKRAIERHKKKETIVIPVIIRSCDWHNTPFAEIKVLPGNDTPLQNWPNKDEAYVEIVTAIRRSLGLKTETNFIKPVINSNTYQSYGNKQIKKFLSSPFIPETFLGRQEDLKNIHQQLFNGPNSLLLLSGEGGIGKTSLAAQYFLQYQNHYQHLAWIYTENNLADGLLTLALPLEISFPDKMPAEERLQVLLNNMHNLQAPCLLVIDNANNQEELEKHYRLLRSCTNFHLLFTSRITAFEQAETYKIEGLPEAEALALFKKHYPKHQPAEDEIFNQVRIAAGGNTLVIELLAKNLFLQNRLTINYTLADLLKDLQQKGLLALGKSKPVASGYHAKNSLRKENPESIIAAMYDLAELTAEERKLLSVFAVLPAENIDFPALEQLLKGIDGFDETLLSLAKKGWLDYNETDNSFKISPVIQGITKKKNHSLSEDCDYLIYNVSEKLDYEGIIGHFTNASYKDAALYARYGEIIENNLTVPAVNLSILLDRLGNYYKTTGNLLKALSFYQSYNQLNKLLFEALPQDAQLKNGLAISFSKLGETYCELGDFNAALHFFTLYNQLMEELHQEFEADESFKNSLAISYCKLGDTHSKLGNMDATLRFHLLYHQSRKELFEDSPYNESYKSGLAISCSKLGETYIKLENFEEALRFSEMDIVLSEELHQARPENTFFKHNLAIANEKRGDIHIALFDFPAALIFLKKSNQLCKELQETWPDNISFTDGLAVTYTKLGLANELDPDKSISKNYYQSAKELWIKLVNNFPDYAGFNNSLKWVNAKLEAYK